MGFKKGIFFIVLIAFFDFASAGLGVTPAIVEIDFKPDTEYIINYKVFYDYPDKEINLFVGGDLAQYAELSANKLIGGGSFTLTLRLPNKIDKPGEHRIGVVAKEKPIGDKVISTTIEIHAVIKVYVPYPGKYAEAELSVINGNVGEDIPIGLNIINQGKDDLNIESYVKFSTEKGEEVYTLMFDRVFIKSRETASLKKFLNTSGYKPGNYFAEAVINYGEEVKINKTFRIGSLFVNITNFTRELQEGGIQKFFIDVENKWNGDLKDVYADVNISNSTKSLIFRTPSIELNAWSNGRLEGFLDTGGLRGEYKTEIILNYLGERSKAFGLLVVLRKGLSSTFYIVGILALIVILIIVFMVWWIRKEAFSRRLK